jgi:hypothetical protein
MLPYIAIYLFVAAILALVDRVYDRLRFYPDRLEALFVEAEPQL